MRPDGAKHTGQAAMLHFAFRQNAAIIKNSWQSGWIITHDLMHSRKSESLVIKKVEFRLLLSRQSVLPPMPESNRLYIGNAQGLTLFIYISHCMGCVTVAPPLHPLSCLPSQWIKELRNTKLDDTYPLFPLSLLQPHCYLHIPRYPATWYSSPDWNNRLDWTPHSNSQL